MVNKVNRPKKHPLVIAEMNSRLVAIQKKGEMAIYFAERALKKVEKDMLTTTTPIEERQTRIYELKRQVLAAYDEKDLDTIMAAGNELRELAGMPPRSVSRPSLRDFHVRGIKLPDITPDLGED